jgi:hypothetical protein
MQGCSRLSGTQIPSRHHLSTLHASASSERSKGAPTQLELSTLLSSQVLMPAESSTASIRCRAACSNQKQAQPKQQRQARSQQRLQEVFSVTRTLQAG